MRPDGFTGLQIPFCTPRQIIQGWVANKIVDFSAANVTLDYRDEGWSGQSVGIRVRIQVAPHRFGGYG